MIVAWLLAAVAQAFPGIVVGTAETDIKLQQPLTVLSRSGDKQVLSFTAQVSATAQDIAVVVPVAGIAERRQLHSQTSLLSVEKLLRFSAARAVFYREADPCEAKVETKLNETMAEAVPQLETHAGDYRFEILTGKDAKAIEKWLTKQKYKLSKLSRRQLVQAAKEKDRSFALAIFTVTKGSASKYLPLLQIAGPSRTVTEYDYAGMATQTHQLLLLSDSGRVLFNNRAAKTLPTEIEIPEYVARGELHAFQDAARNATKEDAVAQGIGKKKVKPSPSAWLKFAWDIGWCEPCVQDPLSAAELRDLGATWLPAGDSKEPSQLAGFLTRWVLPAQTLPLDLTVSDNKETFQLRYLVNEPAAKVGACDGAKTYQDSVVRRLEQVAQSTATFTGWKVADVRAKMRIAGPGRARPDWIDDLWRN
jgi:hypothetical protein